MRALLLSCAVLVSMAGSAAVAQAPQEIISTDTIKMQAEDARSFVFAKPFGRLAITNEEIAQVVPETDRALTIRAFKPGRTYFTVYGTDGNSMYRATLIVEQTAGYVKIYGKKDPRTGTDSPDFMGYYCTDTGCGRADPDKVPVSPNPEQPRGTTITEAQQQPDGSSVSVTRSYPGAGPADTGLRPPAPAPAKGSP